MKKTVYIKLKCIIEKDFFLPSFCGSINGMMNNIKIKGARYYIPKKKKKIII